MPGMATGDLAAGLCLLVVFDVVGAATAHRTPDGESVQSTYDVCV